MFNVKKELESSNIFTDDKIRLLWMPLLFS